MKNPIEIVVGFVLGVLVGILLTSVLRDALWEKDAVKHEAAQYNSQTGAFEWIEKKP